MGSTLGTKACNDRWSRVWLGAMAALVLWGTAGAQYQVFQWENFESGAITPGFAPIGFGFEKQVSVVEYATLPNAPQGLVSAVSSREIGRYGLAINVNKKNPYLGLAVGVILEREKLGLTGRALYQADFFIPDADQRAPSCAVLAMEPLSAKERIPLNFYRFGITVNRDLYFSLMEKGTASAGTYKFDRAYLPTLPRPGWHRFQLIFEGATKVRCYIDGLEMKYSPVEEGKLSQLQVGVMFADREYEYTAYVDNLSIQWTAEDSPLPDSPYSPQAQLTQSNVLPTAVGLPAAVPAASSGASQTASTYVPQTGMTAVQWLDPLNAWQQLQTTKTPMIVYFYAPRVANTFAFNQLVDSDPSAQAFLKQYVLAGIDVNQLQGGTLAQKFSVFRVPTLVLMDAKGQEITRVSYEQGQAWEKVESALKSRPAGQ